MAEKKPFVLRLSPEMMQHLERWAADDFRSINGQIEWILSEALKKRKKTLSKESMDT
ncbi:MAG: Arc family DNA-binding protein [Bacteroidales bacterium]|nr:Arc family DNA-binding protein [Bacteroidales bacterium]